jgi:hypothetical protein
LAKPSYAAEALALAFALAFRDALLLRRRRGLPLPDDERCDAVGAAEGSASNGAPHASSMLQ